MNEKNKNEKNKNKKKNNKQTNITWMYYLFVYHEARGPVIQ